MVRKQAGPTSDRIDEDYPASGHGQAVAMCDHDGDVQVVGDEPSQLRERRSGVTGSKGFEGEAQPPLARSQCTHIG